MNRRRKLLIVNSHPVNYHVGIYRELALRSSIDLDVAFLLDVFKYNPQQKGWTMVYDRELLDGYRSRFLRNISPRPDYSFFGLINPGLVRQIWSGKYDAVLVFGYAQCSSWLAMIASKLSGTAVIFKGEVDDTVARSPLKNWIRSLIVRLFFSQVDFFTYSYARNASFMKTMGVDESKLFFMPCAVDNHLWRARAEASDGDDMRQKFSSDSEVTVFMFCGRLAKHKSPDHLIEAAAKLEPAAKFVLVFAGGGPMEEELRALAEEKGLTTRCHFLGFINESRLAHVFSAADALVLPSYRDPSPKIINETMNFGLPHIVSNHVGTVGDLIVPNRTGLVFPWSDIDALAWAMRFLLDPVKRRKMGENALSSVGKWSFAADADAIEHILDEGLR